VASAAFSGSIDNQRKAHRALGGGRMEEDKNTGAAPIPDRKPFTFSTSSLSAARNPPSTVKQEGLLTVYITPYINKATAANKKALIPVHVLSKDGTLASMRLHSLSYRSCLMLSNVDIYQEFLAAINLQRVSERELPVLACVYCSIQELPLT
jgi:hypothetical protein